jgi:hypothetical protein
MLNSLMSTTAWQIGLPGKDLILDPGGVVRVVKADNFHSDDPFSSRQTVCLTICFDTQG